MKRLYGCAWLALPLLILGGMLSCATAPPASLSTWPHDTLRAAKSVLLNLPQGERFDASGLLLTPEGGLLTISDRGASVYRIESLAGSGSANLVLLPDVFTPAQLAPLARFKHGRYDCEGLARDPQGRLYLCEETDRWILRWDPRTRTVEQLAIDWAPVRKYFSRDPNASFEGIAVNGNTLYVANERQRGRIIVVDLTTLKVSDSFVVRPRGCQARDVHYSDLCWFEGGLYVLLRESRMVLRVEPQSHQVLAEYDFSALENQSETAYRTVMRYPTSTMEGLAVGRDGFWLVTDNNGLGRLRHPEDIRPTLFFCPWPDAAR